MNNINDFLDYSAHRQEITTALSAQFGLSQTQTDQACQMLVSAILGGIVAGSDTDDKQEESCTSFDLKKLEKLLTRIKTPGENLFTILQEGKDILGYFIGSGDISEKIAASIERKTAVERKIIITMMPVMAVIVLTLLQTALRSKGEESFAAQIENLKKQGIEDEFLSESRSSPR